MSTKYKSSVSGRRNTEGPANSNRLLQKQSVEKITYDIPQYVILTAHKLTKLKEPEGNILKLAVV